jgi:hypothetical protein
MINFKSVLAFGDSNVAGLELARGVEEMTEEYRTGKATVDELDLPGKLLAFPQIVADHFDVPCYNYAMSGGSNNRSLRLLTQAVIDHPDSLALFGYTSTDRNEIYYPKGGFGCDMDNFLQIGVQWGDRFDMPANKHYLQILYPYNNLKSMMFCVDSICRLYTKKYLHIPLFDEEIPKMNNIINFGGATNYHSWAHHNNFTTTKNYHHGIDAHTELAKLIIKEITFNVNNS